MTLICRTVLRSRINIKRSIVKRGYATITALSGSNLPTDLKHAIEKEVQLPTFDPAFDSQTQRIISSDASFMVPTYVRPPLVISRGKGCYVFDVENRRYLDFTSGIAVTSLGHCDAEITNLLTNQSSQLIHASNLYYNPWIGALSKLLVDTTLSTGGFSSASKAFICNSGSEANEAAIKFARKSGFTLDPSGKKHELVSFHGAFHGRTMGSLSATPNPKYQKPFAPLLPGFKYGQYNDSSSEVLAALITENTAGVIVEPIQGEGGINVATSSFLAGLRKRCDETGAILIYDEIQCGLSRTGSFWAHSCPELLETDISPDILTTAKALGNGIPIGATIVSGKVAERIKVGDHGTTFGGNPLACRIACNVIERLSNGDLMDGVKRKEKIFKTGFEKLMKRWSKNVLEVRGKGLILGLQLDRDPKDIVTAARERGLLIITCGTNTLRFVPPLIISEEQISDGLKILEDAMEVVFDTDETVIGTRGQQEMAR